MAGDALAPDGRPSLVAALASGSVLPVSVVAMVIVVIWYIATIPMNWVLTAPRIEAAGGGLGNILAISWGLDRPVLPAPHQVLVELWNTVFTVAPWRPRSLLFHCWVTLSSTLVGFIFGTMLGIGLAIAIVHVRSLEKSLLPWIIASQTIPILAIAPMVILILANIGVTGLIPKAIISMYLCFFPVTIGMVKGLRSPDPQQMDLLRTYNASQWQVFWKLRVPASIPFLFASLKVAIAISLVGAIVGELPTGAEGGLGARMLASSYYGQMVQIWSALLMAAMLGMALVYLIAGVEWATLRRTGGRA
jgi:NitT/TauT family transport system permease protein